MGLAGFNRMRRLQAEVEAKAAEEIEIEVEKQEQQIEEVMADDEVFDFDDEDTEMQEEKLSGKRKKKR